jgi:hypothetical protein
LLCKHHGTDEQHSGSHTYPLHGCHHTLDVVETRDTGRGRLARRTTEHDASVMTARREAQKRPA